MDTYKKSAVISIVAGMLTASFGAALLDIQYFGVVVAINDFFRALPRSIIFAGLPSWILTAIILAIWKKSGKSEKGMKLTCLFIGIITGALCTIPLIMSYGM
jgi:hypothetical protein